MSDLEGDVLVVLCPSCGERIVLTEGAISHHDSVDAGPCSLSGSPAWIPGDVFKVAYHCEVCKQVTKSNLRTGVIFSHNLPDSTSVCTNSGKFIGPVGATVTATLLPLKKRKKVKGAPRIDSTPRDSGSSVRTVSGGLPGSRR